MGTEACKGILLSSTHCLCWKLLPKVQNPRRLSYRHFPCIIPVKALLYLPCAQSLQRILKICVHHQDQLNFHCTTNMSFVGHRKYNDILEPSISSLSNQIMLTLTSHHHCKKLFSLYLIIPLRLTISKTYANYSD